MAALEPEMTLGDTRSISTKHACHIRCSSQDTAVQTVDVFGWKQHNTSQHVIFGQSCAQFTRTSM